MGAWRTFLRRYPHLAVLALALALLMKSALPGGVMVAPSGTVLTVTLCADASGSAGLTRHIVIPRENPGDGGGAQDSKGACPFAVLAMTSLGAADPVLLAAALAFVLALGLTPMPLLRVARKPRLNPPLRGPPLLA